MPDPGNMQPLHPKEARWFYQWDRLEILRGTGLSLFITGFLFLIAFALGAIALPPGHSLRLSAAGFLLFALAGCLDSCGKMAGLRKIRCRSCRSVFPMGRIMENGWRCKKCGTGGLFDNLE